MMALVAVFALSAVLAATASAEATLLAEWLIEGKGVTTLTSTESLGTILLEDLTFGAGVECTATFIGSVGPSGEDETTEVKSDLGTFPKVTLAAPLTVASEDCKIVKGCASADPVEVSPSETLPWHTLMFLDETTGAFLDVVFSAGYEVTCTILGIKSTDTCTVTNGIFEVLASAEGAEAFGTVEPKANCSLGGTGQGDEEFIGANHTLTLTGVPVIPSE